MIIFVYSVYKVMIDAKIKPVRFCKFVQRIKYGFLF